MIHSFAIFDRHCQCVYHREFGSDLVNKSNNTDASKLLFGIVYSLKNLSNKLASDNVANFLKSFSTANFRVHYFESLTNLKFVLVSDVSIDNLQNVLWELYSNYYVRHVSLNSLADVDFKTEDDKIANPVFVAETDAFLKSLPVYQ